MTYPLPADFLWITAVHRIGEHGLEQIMQQLTQPVPAAGQLLQLAQYGFALAYVQRQKRLLHFVMAELMQLIRTIGKKLFLAAREELMRLSLRGCIVWVLEENQPAVQFYKNAGGVDVAEGSESFNAKTLNKIAFAWN